VDREWKEESIITTADVATNSATNVHTQTSEHVAHLALALNIGTLVQQLDYVVRATTFRGLKQLVAR
jgi:hypothetical protein